MCLKLCGSPVAMGFFLSREPLPNFDEGCFVGVLTGLDSSKDLFSPPMKVAFIWASKPLEFLAAHSIDDYALGRFSAFSYHRAQIQLGQWITFRIKLPLPDMSSSKIVDLELRPSLQRGIFRVSGLRVYNRVIITKGRVQDTIQRLCTQSITLYQLPVFSSPCRCRLQPLSSSISLSHPSSILSHSSFRIRGETRVP